MAEPSEKVKVVIRRKKGGHGGHHGGAWKVAYADFVTAMMAFFMVMWLLTQADLKLRSQIAQYFRNPGILPGGAIVNGEVNPFKSREPQLVAHDITIVQFEGKEQPPGKPGSEAEQREARATREQKRLEQHAKQLEQAIEQAVKSTPEIGWLKDRVIIQVTDAGLEIEVVDKAKVPGLDRADRMFFDLSSAELKPPLVALLREIAGVLGQLPNQVQVGGHTDARPFPPESPKTNWQLSFERADAARRVMEAGGLWRGQVSRVLSFADSRPLIPDKPLADENRRLSILAEREGLPPGQAAAEDGPGPIVLPPDTLPSRSTEPAPEAPAPEGHPAG